MVKKYTNMKYPDNIIPTLKNTYLKQYTNWFEGYFPTGPSTNNALEGWNRSLKDIYFNWEKKSM